jgi:hypothetical protein
MYIESAILPLRDNYGTGTNRACTCQSMPHEATFNALRIREYPFIRIIRRIIVVIRDPFEDGSRTAEEMEKDKTYEDARESSNNASEILRRDRMQYYDRFRGDTLSEEEAKWQQEEGAELLRDSAGKKVQRLVQIDGWYNVPPGEDDIIIGDEEGHALTSSSVKELRNTESVRIQIPIDAPKGEVIALLEKKIAWIKKDFHRMLKNEKDSFERNENYKKGIFKDPFDSE